MPIVEKKLDGLFVTFQVSWRLEERPCGPRGWRRYLGIGHKEVIAKCGLRIGEMARKGEGEKSGKGKNEPQRHRGHRERMHNGGHEGHEEKQIRTEFIRQD